MADVLKFYDVEGRAIRFRNFAGKAGKFNNEGEKNFCLILDPQDAQEMAEEGYNIKYLKPKDENDEPIPYVKIKVAYRNRYGEMSKIPPKVVQITKAGKTILSEDSVSNLDWAEIDKADISIRPREYEPGKISAYLKTMYVTLVQDDFEDRYYDVPDSAQNIVDVED